MPKQYPVELRRRALRLLAEARQQEQYDTEWAATRRAWHHRLARQPTRTVYRRVLGFTVALRFVEEDVLRGVALAPDRLSGGIALRHDPDRAKALSAFNAIALLVSTREEGHAWKARLDEPRRAAQRDGYGAPRGRGPRAPLSATNGDFLMATDEGLASSATAT